MTSTKLFTVVNEGPKPVPNNPSHNMCVKLYDPLEELEFEFDEVVEEINDIARLIAGILREIAKQAATPGGITPEEANDIFLLQFVAEDDLGRLRQTIDIFESRVRPLRKKLRKITRRGGAIAEAAVMARL